MVCDRVSDPVGRRQGRSLMPPKYDYRVLLGRSGAIWQEELFDHVLRSK